MKKKGFTLIELLAVIVIIAVLAIITVPLLTGVIEKTKKGAVKDSVYGLFEAVNLYRATNANLSGNIVFTCDGTNCQADNGDILLFKGEIPTSGQIILKSEKEIEAYYLKIGGYCALGNLKTLDVQEDCSKLDISRPNLTVEKITQSSKSIVVKVIASDIESGIKSITYEIDGRVITDNYDTTNVEEEKIISGLSAGFTGDLKVTVTNGNDLTTEKTISISTNPMTLTLKLNKTPTEAVNDYYNEIEAYMDYGTEEITGYYVKSTKEGTSSVSLTSSCGTDTVPGSCSNITGTTTMTAGTWYYSDIEPRITYNTTSTEVGTLYARITNGVSYVNASLTIPKIDKQAPSVSLGTSIVTSKSISIPITSSDSESGLDTVTCKYSTTSGSYTETSGVTASTSNCTISNINHDTTYYYQVCIKDKIGNETCKTGNSKTNALTLTLSSTKTPSSAVNGYYEQEVWNINTTGNPTGYYIKSTKEGTSSVSLTSSCGTDTTPGSCSNITGTTTMTAGTWYYVTSKPSITYSKTITINETLYARITDGKNTTANASATTVKIDKQAPSVSLGTGNVTSKSISIPVTSSDSESGLDTVTCKYSTTSGSYTETSGVTASTSNCIISNINHDTTYYYQVCIKDKIGNETCKTGNSKTTALTLTLSSTKTPSSAVNGYYEQEVWNINTTGNPTGYYIKSTKEGTSSVSLTSSCGTGTTPGNCSNITGTTTMTANTWYYVTSKPSITYSKTSTSNETLYARITDGKNTTANASGTTVKIDKQAPSVSLGTGNVTSKSISIPVTSSDNESGLGTATCKYSTTSGSYTETSGVTATTSNCTISNINHDTTYYYQVCIKDKIGNETCKTGNSKTNALTVALSSTKTAYQPLAGYYTSETWTLNTTGNPTGYYIKSTKEGTSSVSLTSSCGTGTTPGSCSNITSTTTMTANTWYYVTSKPSITYNKTDVNNGTLYARITDGKNTTANASATTAKIKQVITAAEVGITISGNSSIENVKQALDDLYNKVSN